MNEKKIEPTDAMVADVGVVKTWFGLTSVRDILGLALNHPDTAGLFECDHTDYVHVDEAATRVEAAREQGWDDAAQHIYNKGWEGVTALRKANPHRPALSLPTDAFATNPPADNRPWEPLNGGRVYVGDEVRQERAGITTTAVVGRVDDAGDPWTDARDPWTDGGALIGLLRHGTWYVRRTIPAPTPPAEEVELPGEQPAHLLDVEITGRAKCVHMELDRYGYWIGVDQEGYPRQWPLRWIAAFTLPDGTRARRDGEHEDGEPRFVKVQEGEK